jgi:hypothetical protein
MLAWAQEARGAPEAFNFVDEEIYPEFARRFNQGDRTEVAQRVVVWLFRDRDKPSPFPKGGSGFVFPDGAEEGVYLVHRFVWPDGH